MKVLIDFIIDHCDRLDHSPFKSICKSKIYDFLIAIFFFLPSFAFLSSTIIKIIIIIIISAATTPQR